VKKTRTESELEARRAAQGNGMLLGAAAALVGTVMAALSGDFLALNCGLTVAAAVAGGRAAATAAARVDPGSRSSAGVIGGMWTALAFATPFALAAVYRWATLDAAGAAARLAALTPAELAQLQQFNIQPGLEYFSGWDLSYAFGYLLGAALMGWLGGMIGAALSKRE